MVVSVQLAEKPAVEPASAPVAASVAEAGAFAIAYLQPQKPTGFVQKPPPFATASVFSKASVLSALTGPKPVFALQASQKDANAIGALLIQQSDLGGASY